jgi:hypothetical protein
MKMAYLYFLNSLNLSNNHLFVGGRIPSSTQLQSFDASVFSGNGCHSNKNASEMRRIKVHLEACLFPVLG